MKLFIAAAVLACVKLSRQGVVEMSQEGEALIAECIKESEVNPDLVKSFLDKELLSTDPRFKCFLNCFAISISLMKPSGDIDAEILKYLLTSEGAEPETADEIVKECEKPEGDDGCEMAYNLMECIGEAMDDE